MTARQERKRRSAGPLAALLGVHEHAEHHTVVVVARSVAEDPGSWAGVAGRVVEDDKLGHAVRELGDRVEVVAAQTLDASLLRSLRDRIPPLLVFTGEVEAEALAELEELARRHGRAILGPLAALRVGPQEDARGAPAPVACAAQVGELQRLCDALGPTRLSLAPTPAWLPRWLGGPMLLAHDVVGYVPAAALALGWIDWISSLGRRELRQLLVPLGVPRVQLEAQDPTLEPALVAHSLERVTGPTYPAPQVLALIHEAARRHLDPREHTQDHQPPPAPDASALALWEQARRALPRTGERIGMQRPDPALSLRVPTAAFLAQRGLLRARTSATLLADRLEIPEPHEPELLERADVVLEGAAEVLSDHESKVVLRGHGIEVTRQAFANSASGAASFADKIGYPVALKALSPELRRKRELGAVELDVANAAAVKRAYADIVNHIEERAPMVQLDGVVVAEMIEPGLDVHCGGLRLRSGGVAVFVRALVDAAVEPVLAASPLSGDDALLLAEAALHAVPLPARRRASDPDVSVLAQLLLRIDGLFRHTGERLLAVELSPVRLVDSDRQYVTLDARMVQRPHLEGR